MIVRTCGVGYVTSPDVNPDLGFEPHCPMIETRVSGDVADTGTRRLDIRPIEDEPGASCHAKKRC